MRSSFEGTWLDEINKNSKLRTYCTIKGNFVRCEDYLDTLQFNYRRQFTKLRLSAHKLHVETGRHTRPITPVNDRKCNECETDEIEDEYHVIMKCNKYANKRQELFNSVTRECPLFSALDDISKFYFIMNCCGQMLKDVARFVQYIFVTRDNPRRFLS